MAFSIPAGVLGRVAAATVKFPDTCDMPMTLDAVDDTAALSVGTQVGDFEIIAVLASSVCGPTYLAIDQALCRLAALQEFAPPKLAARGTQGQVEPRSGHAAAIPSGAFEAALARFMRHAELLATLDHPALVKVYRVFQVQGTAYAAMPFAMARTWQESLDDLGHPPDPAWLRQRLAPLSHALACLHAQQLHGCALSPAALLVQPGKPFAQFMGLWPGDGDAAADIQALDALAGQAMPRPLPQAQPASVAQWRSALGFAEADGGSLAPAVASHTGAAAEPVRDNLPQHATALLGREQETLSVRAHLARARLVTLTGIGGVGKTRLALQVGQDSLGAFTDGVWFLDLSSVRDPQRVVPQAAQVLGVREVPGQTLVQALLAFFKGRYLLLIVDNCEHLIAAASSFINQAVRGSPGLRVLASSREALRVPGEVAYPVLPLPVPDSGAALDALQACSSVRLFVARAQDYRHSFRLTEDNRHTVAELVRRLEGIPLALELAAARVRTLSVADINRRLQDRFQLLTRGPHVLHARQQTLRATVDWSYELLHDDEKTLLSRLGVFVGGLDLEAAEAVCGTAPLDPADVMDLLRLLVDKSLVMLDERDGGTRYQLLETLRDYALEKLRDSGGSEPVAAAHGMHYFALAKQLRDGLQGKDQGEWVRRGEADLDNLRAAMALALAGGIDPFISVKMAVALQGFWGLRGYMTEGRALVRQALARPDVQADPMPYAHALYVGAALALMQGDLDAAHDQLVTCLALRRALGNPADIAATLSTLAHAHIHDTVQARAWANEALELLRALGIKQHQAIVLQDLGRIAQFDGDLALARDHFMQSLALARQVRHPETEAECERLLGELALELEDLTAAQQHLQKSRQVCTAAGDMRGEASARLWLGKLAMASGDQPTAAGHLAAALQFFQSHEMRAEWLDCLAAIAALGARRPDTAQALQLLRAVEALVQQLRLVRPQREVACNARLLQALAGGQATGAAPVAEPWNLTAATAVALQMATA